MRALIIHCENADFSFVYDGLTIYPKSRSAALDNALAECSKLSFVKKPFRSMRKRRDKKRKEISNLKNEIKFMSDIQKVDFEKYVFLGEVDHNFYHQDNLNPPGNYLPHRHLKFSHPINHDQFDTILNVLILHQYLTNSEKESLLHTFDQRYKHTRKALAKAIIRNTNKDISITKIIIDFIACHDDIDILIDLHEYLLSKKFAYLRENSSHSKLTIWQGTVSNNTIRPTTKKWAKIEKAFALQIANTIKLNIEYDPDTRTSRANQLARSLSFFAIKRKQSEKSQNSKFFKAFIEGNEDMVVERYNKHFNLTKN